MKSFFGVAALLCSFVIIPASSQSFDLVGSSNPASYSFSASSVSPESSVFLRVEILNGDLGSSSEYIDIRVGSAPTAFRCANVASSDCSAAAFDCGEYDITSLIPSGSSTIFVSITRSPDVNPSLCSRGVIIYRLTLTLFDSPVEVPATSSSVSYTFTNLVALSPSQPVLLTIEAIDHDLDLSTEYIDVTVGGVYQGRCLESGGLQCSSTPLSCLGQLDVTSLITSGSLLVQIVSSSAVGPGVCSNPFYRLRLSGASSPNLANPLLPHSQFFHGSAGTTSSTFSHTFTGIDPAAISVGVALVLFNGDFDLTSEYVDVFGGGALVGRCADALGAPQCSTTPYTCPQSFDMTEAVTETGELTVSIRSSANVNQNLCTGGAEYWIYLMVRVGSVSS